MGANNAGVDTSCPRCLSKNTMYRKTTDMLWCRRCGFEYKPPWQDKAVKPNNKATAPSKKKQPVKKTAKAKK